MQSSVPGCWRRVSTCEASRSARRNRPDPASGSQEVALPSDTAAPNTLNKTRDEEKARSQKKNSPLSKLSHVHHSIETFPLLRLVNFSYNTRLFTHHKNNTRKSRSLAYAINQAMNLCRRHDSRQSANCSQPAIGQDLTTDWLPNGAQTPSISGWRGEGHSQQTTATAQHRWIFSRLYSKS